MKIRIDSADGRSWAVPHTEGHAAAGLAYVEVSDEWWNDYQAYRELDRKWQSKLLPLDNLQYAKDRPDDEWAQQFVKDVNQATEKEEEA